MLVPSAPTSNFLHENAYTIIAVISLAPFLVCGVFLFLVFDVTMPVLLTHLL